jgi:hypothetical protein
VLFVVNPHTELRTIETVTGTSATKRLEKPGGPLGLRRPKLASDVSLGILHAQAKRQLAAEGREPISRRREKEDGVDHPRLVDQG